MEPKLTACKMCKFRLKNFYETGDACNANPYSPIFDSARGVFYIVHYKQCHDINFNGYCQFYSPKLSLIATLKKIFANFFPRLSNASIISDEVEAKDKEEEIEVEWHKI